MKRLLLSSALIISLSVTPAFADGDSESTEVKKSKEKIVKIDRSKRASPYSATPFSVMSSRNEASRYRTDQGWSRGGTRGYWGYYGSSRSDIPTTGYTEPVRKGDRK